VSLGLCLETGYLRSWKLSNSLQHQVQAFCRPSFAIVLTCLGHDIQLKILQALPSLLQNYPSEVRGELLSTVLQICSGLQNTKNPAVSNTAAATLQQLVIAIFDRVVVEDGEECPICSEPTLTLARQSS